METLLQTAVFFGTFAFMEFLAWFIHKYIMHGLLWSLHKDHHRKDHKSWFERNDVFFAFYAGVSMFFFVWWGQGGVWFDFPIGLGIVCYGGIYFLVHDIFIHRRLKIFRNTSNRYLQGLRKAHQVHHKYVGREGGECFGMLFVPFKFFRR